MSGADKKPNQQGGRSPAPFLPAGTDAEFQTVKVEDVKDIFALSVDTKIVCHCAQLISISACSRPDASPGPVEIRSGKCTRCTSGILSKRHGP